MFVFLVLSDAKVCERKTKFLIHFVWIIRGKTTILVQYGAFVIPLKIVTWSSPLLRKCEDA